jgi:hypothetical protein
MFQEYLTTFEVTFEEALKHLRSFLSGILLLLRLCVEYLLRLRLCVKYFTAFEVMCGVFTAFEVMCGVF